MSILIYTQESENRMKKEKNNVQSRAYNELTMIYVILDIAWCL